MASPRRTRWGASAALLAAALTVSGCSIFSVTSPSPSRTPGTHSRSPSPTPTASPTSPPGTTRTVTATYGLNMHRSASLSAAVVGTLVWGDTVTVLGYTATGGPWPNSAAPGAWYEVQGQTTTGWIVADPSYSVPGSLSSISFADKHIDGLLYPDSWTWADDPGEVIFQPQNGIDQPTLVLRVAAGLAALGPAGLTGYATVSSDTEVVTCGYTGTQVNYRAGPGATAEPTTDAGGGRVTRLAEFAQFRATLSTSPAVAVDIEMNYSTASDYTVFENALSSVRFPFPQCEAAPSPTP